MIKAGKIKLSPRQMMLRRGKSAFSNILFCKNNCIKKWYLESIIVKVISPADMVKLNYSIVQKLKQSAEETQKDIDHGYDNWRFYR